MRSVGGQQAFVHSLCLMMRPQHFLLKLATPGLRRHERLAHGRRLPVCFLSAFARRPLGLCLPCLLPVAEGAATACH